MELYKKFGIGEREVRAKIWDLDGKQWLSGDYRISTESGKVYGKYGEEIKSVAVVWNTGLKDKNGKKIFEGDITKNKYGVNHVIGFRDGGFSLLDKSGRHGTWFDINGGEEMVNKSEIEVVGNIFQNSDLLNPN